MIPSRNCGSEFGCKSGRTQADPGGPTREGRGGDGCALRDRRQGTGGTGPEYRCVLGNILIISGGKKRKGRYKLTPAPFSGRSPRAVAACGGGLRSPHPQPATPLCRRGDQRGAADTVLPDGDIAISRWYHGRIQVFGATRSPPRYQTISVVARVARRQGRTAPTRGDIAMAALRGGDIASATLFRYRGRECGSGAIIAGPS